MRRIIRTANLICIELHIYPMINGRRASLFPIAHVDEMPQRMPIELIEEWDQIAELVFKDFIDAGR